MKKSLIALAVLAASGAAMAQSSVTLYGVVDIYVGSNEVQVGGIGQRQTVVNSDGVNGNRWGLKGAEDLGGGMKAIFQLESGFTLDNGASAQGGLLFGRQAFVGLESGFGTVSVGRHYSAYDNLHGATSHNYDAFSFNAARNFVSADNRGTSANGMADYTNRLNNSVAYTSPSFGGFSGSVVYGLGENKNAPTNLNGDATDSASVHIKYANGPLLVGYAYQQDKLAAVAGVQNTNKYNLVGGTYDFGVAKIVGYYNTAKNNTFKDKEGQIGVAVPFGAAAISAGVSRSKSTSPGVERTGKGYAILGTYALSKRTGLYVGGVNTTYHALNAAAESKLTTYGLGVRHSF